MMRVIILVAAIIGVCFVLLASFFIPGIPVIKERPSEYMCEGCNVIIVTVDTLRADHVSSYGYFSETTPNMDGLASRGILFEDAYSQIPHTPPSHWSIFTGLYPHIHGRYAPLDNGSGLVTLSDVLSENGYATGAFTGSHVVSGFSHEFDNFNGYTGDKRLQNFGTRIAGESTDNAISWLGNHSDDKFLLWVHYYDPHSPYEPPAGHDIFNYSATAEYAGIRYSNYGLSGRKTIRGDIADYDGEIRYTDYSIGRLVNEIETLGLSDRTVFVIISDHGECFGEHNFTEFGYDKNKACTFHGKTLYEEEIHIPFIIVNPQSEYVGSRIENVVESVDVFPTVLGMLGIEAPESNGESLLPLIVNGTREKDYVFIQTIPRKGFGFSVGIKEGDWKFVRMVPSEFDFSDDEDITMNSSSEEDFEYMTELLLFTTIDDERINHIEDEKETALRLEQNLGDVIYEGQLPTDIGISEDAEKILKALGYMS